MEEIYERMREESGRIASRLKHSPCFYTDQQGPVLISRDIYSNNSEVKRCRELVASDLLDNLGHGMDHAEKVTIDIGAIVCIEGKSESFKSHRIEDLIVVAQLSGLLHDIKRKEPNHARASAKEAEVRLREFPLKEEEREIIVQAISNHEAFIDPEKVSTPIGQMISDSLYDADKFRWGIDNFTGTLWYMADFRKTPIESIIANFQKGMESIKRIRDTFRTETGKKYGPEFIDLGLEIGDEVYNYLLSERKKGTLCP